ncbi:hypothetical protein N7478_007660 [Penicillium angulare]|uniref:uncharacterized protein n=1 Tax=Penicillium angulare TaxID=116970 RepID=UPI00253FABA0|nr:uncharacterized protein N7478_007660 [Penicillium angulare]KAJ5272535.1 hypothetical protein N7478_007660 [Penicillium angulare]
MSEKKAMSINKPVYGYSRAGYSRHASSGLQIAASTTSSLHREDKKWDYILKDRNNTEIVL